MPNELKKRLIVEEQINVVEPKVEIPVPEIVKPLPSPEIVVPEKEISIMPEIEVAEKRMIPKWIVFVLGLMLGGALGAGLVLGFNLLGPKILKDRDVVSDNSKVEISSPVIQVTPTPVKKELKRSDLKIRVENGSGIKGAASMASDKLTTLGYEVISVGNSENNTKLTTISLSKEKYDYLEMLTRDMASNYELATISGVVNSTEDYDALVVVNK